VVELAQEFGTPAYVYAEDDIRSRAQEYLDAFGARTQDFEVVYASKAAPIGAILSLLAEMGLSVDVASAGELHAALRAGAAPDRIYLHGNNKTETDLRLATGASVGHIVCDSFDEIERLDGMLDRPQQVMIRVTPGIKANTHSYIQTGQLDSKFGFGLDDGLAARGIDAIRESSNLKLAGLHAHIGSQIFELEPYVKTIEALGRLADEAGLSADELRLLNVGGGLGIAYEPSDEPPSIESYVDVKVKGVERVFDPVPRILVEPGRSLVGNAGVTLYEVGTVKEIPGVRTYVAVDGGMSDNLRPMLYDARYDALIANRASEARDTRVTVAGMHCESSDIIVREVEMAAPRVGDVLATPATGAYGHAMANNYNGMPRPPVVFAKDGEARAVVRRETRDDLVARDVQ
jgi:diaminopimelate decarboxylase